MKTNVQITAVKKEFKNGQNGYEVKVEGMDGKLDCKMNFHEPLKAMRYMFLLSKRLELQIDSIQLAALSLAYQRAKARASESSDKARFGIAERSRDKAIAKEAEQKAVEDANAVLAEVGEAEEQSEPAPEAKSEEPAPEEPSSLIKQFDELKAKHPEAVLLFRCGDFYESYREDAEVLAQVLGITLTKRSSDKLAMAGFPYHALDTYLPKLIRAGKRVAICDQIEQSASKNLVKRGITELVTPSEAEKPAEPAAPKRRGRKPASDNLFKDESAA